MSYAYKKDSKGERHGTMAERHLAERKRALATSQTRPHTMFAMAPKQPGALAPPPSGPQVRDSLQCSAGDLVTHGSSMQCTSRMWRAPDTMFNTGPHATVMALRSGSSGLQPGQGCRSAQRACSSPGPLGRSPPHFVLQC